MPRVGSLVSPPCTELDSTRKNVRTSEISLHYLLGSETPITPVTCGFGRAGRRRETGQSRPLEGPAGHLPANRMWMRSESDALRSSPGGSACPCPPRQGNRRPDVRVRGA